MTPQLPNSPEEQALAETLGQRVHAIWSQFALPLLGVAIGTPIAWNDLDDGHKEIKRRIGLAIWKDCLAAYAPAVAAAMARAAPTTAPAATTPTTKTNHSVSTSGGFWRKLSSGNWGISLQYKTPIGSKVKISNKSGEIQEVVVGRLVSDANGYWLHEIGTVGAEAAEEAAVSDDGGFLEYEQKPKAKHKSKHMKRLSNSEQVEELEASEYSGFVDNVEDDGVPW